MSCQILPEQSTLHGEYLKMIPNIHLRVLIWNQTGLLETYVFGQYCLYVKLLALSFMLALCLKGTVMWTPLQLTLEQHRFKLCRFICRHFFNKYIEYHMIWDWLNLRMWSMTAKGWQRDLSICGFYSLGYVLEPIPCVYWGYTCNLFLIGMLLRILSIYLCVLYVKSYKRFLL